MVGDYNARVGVTRSHGVSGANKYVEYPAKLCAEKGLAIGNACFKKKKKDCLHKSTYVSKGVSQQALLHYVLILNV